MLQVVYTFTSSFALLGVSRIKNISCRHMESRCEAILTLLPHFLTESHIGQEMVTIVGNGEVHNVEPNACCRGGLGKAQEL